MTIYIYDSFVEVASHWCFFFKDGGAKASNEIQSNRPIVATVQ